MSSACSAASCTGVAGRRQVSARRTGLERRGRAWLFYSGLATIVIALDSPLDSLSSQLFAAHMTQHVLLLDRRAAADRALRAVEPALAAASARLPAVGRPDGRALPRLGSGAFRGPRRRPSAPRLGAVQRQSRPLARARAVRRDSEQRRGARPRARALLLAPHSCSGGRWSTRRRSTPRSTGSSESRT